MPLMRSISASASSGTINKTSRAVASPVLSRSSVDDESCAFAPSTTPFTSANVFSTSVEKSASRARRFKRNAAGRVHVLFRKRDRDGGELHLRVHVFERALHLLDLRAHAAELFLDFEQIGDLAALRLENVDEPRSITRALFRRESVSKYCFVTSSVPSVWFFTSPRPRSFERKRSRFSGHDFDDHLSLQFAVRLLVRAARRDVAAIFRWRTR